jgi:hypothetical protein
VASVVALAAAGAALLVRRGEGSTEGTVAV